MALLGFGVLIVLVAGPLLFRLFKSLEPMQRIVLAVVVVLGVAYLANDSIRAYRVGAQIRQQQRR